MAIQALPATTTRILNSSQALTTPASLVKELVDNALDAKSSSIDIIISSNTLDKIEVRDNGHGIATDDLSVLGRRGYTSKLRNFEELSTVAGTSLGFRGEALASAVELGDVTVTTRSDGEAVATAVMLKAPGIIIGQTIASHPVGTTVSVANFLAKLPVRKQTAIKESKKTLLIIKRMLHSYALARINVRLQLKVLKSSKSNWSFAPRPNGSIREAVSQVIGPDTAAQCMENTSIWNPVASENESVPDNAETPSGVFIFQAFAPRPSADFSKITGGHHVSIDSRPVSCVKGPLKRIVALYKAHIRAVAGNEFADKLKDPFIRVNIVCPSGSYDPNVEPAKDDVIFANPSVLPALTEQWLNAVYGDPTSARSFNHTMAAMNNESERILAKKDEVDWHHAETPHKDSNELPTIDNSSNHRVTAHIYPLPTEFQQPRLAYPRQTHARKDAIQSPLEAWFHRSPAVLSVEDEGIANTESNPSDQIENTTPPSAPAIRRHGNLGTGFISASTLPQVPPSQSLAEAGEFGGSPTVDDVSHTGGDSYGDSNIFEDFIEDLDPSDSISQVPRMRSPNVVEDDEDGDDGGISHLNPWTIAKLVGSTKLPRPTPVQNFEKFIENKRLKQNAHTARVISHSRQAPVQPLAIGANRSHATHIFTTSQRAPTQQHSMIVENTHPIRGISSLHLVRQRQHLMPEKIPHVKDSSCLTPAHVPSIKDAGHIIHPFRLTQPVQFQELSMPNDIKSALGYERHKDIATRKTKEHIRSQPQSNDVVGYQAQGAIEMNPSRNAAQPAPVASIGMSTKYDHPRIVQQGNKSIMASFPVGDPRAYLIRRQKSLATFEDRVGQPKLKRTKTLLLPLESITESTRLNRLVHFLSGDIDGVRKAALSLKGKDGRVRSGKEITGLDVPEVEYGEVEKRIRYLVRKMLQSTVSGKTCDVDLDFTGLRGRTSTVD